MHRKELSPNRVTIVVPTIPPEFAGGGRRALMQARELAARGVEVELITFVHNSLEERNLTITTLPAPPASRARRLLYYGRLFAHAARHLEANPPALVHFISCYTWSQVILGACVALDLRVILEMTLAGADDADSIEHARGAWLRYPLFREANHFVSISPLLDEIIRSHEVPERQRCIIPNGVDIAKFNPASPAEKRALRADLDIDLEKTILVYVGAISERKRVHLLIEALANVGSGQAIELLLVGPEIHQEEYKTRLERLIEERKLDGLVRFVGLVERPQDWLRAADVFVFASSSEGFGTVQVEAMSCGLPSVILEIPGLTEFIFDHNRSALIARNTGDFVRNLDTLLNSRSLRRRLADGARNSAVSRFGQNAVTDRYLELYAEFGVPSN